jgi:hypothetical protein
MNFFKDERKLKIIENHLGDSAETILVSEDNSVYIRLMDAVIEKELHYTKEFKHQLKEALFIYHNQRRSYFPKDENGKIIDESDDEELFPEWIYYPPFLDSDVFHHENSNLFAAKRADEDLDRLIFHYGERQINKFKVEDKIPAMKDEKIKEGMVYRGKRSFRTYSSDFIWQDNDPINFSSYLFRYGVIYNPVAHYLYLRHLRKKKAWVTSDYSKSSIEDFKEHASSCGECGSLYKF